MNRREFTELIGAAALTSAFAKSNAQATSNSAPFRFSVMLWTIEKKLPFDRCLELVAAAGYNGVELTGQFNQWSPDQTRARVAKMHSLNLICDAISGVDADFSDPGGADQLLAKLGAHIELAKSLGCPQILMLSGKRNPTLPRQTQHQACIENLKRAGDLAARHNIQLVIEPIDPLENPPIYLTSVSEGFQIVRAVGSQNVKVLYDFYHEQRCAGNLIEKLEKNVDWVGLVHIADVPGRHDPGTGEIDYRNIYRKLAELKYNRFIAMEYYPTGAPLESLTASRLAAIDTIRSVPAPYKP